MSFSRSSRRDAPRSPEPGMFAATFPSPSVIDNQKGRVESSHTQHDVVGESAAGTNRGLSPLSGHGSPNSTRTISSNGDSTEQANRKSWRKGGFLLGSSSSSRQGHQSSADGSPRSSMDFKGKRKSDGNDLAVRKHRARDGNTQSLSHIASPLSNEVKNNNGIGYPHGNDGYARAPTISLWSGSSQRDSFVSHQPSLPSSQTSEPQSIGYDTDPAQIVSMALALNEGRRRHFSNPRGLPSVDLKPLSNSPGFNPRITQPGRQTSLGRYLQGGRQASKNNSPRSRNITGRSARSTPGIRLSSYTSTGSRDSTHDMESPDEYYDVSDATYARAEKAKTELELLYEYRRLLQHLPPIKRPEDSAPKSSTSSTYPPGRAYNPLQYVRNRKVRFREKQTMATQEEGWDDVVKVRGWVDAVTNANTGGRKDPYDCIRLPQLPDNKLDTTSVSDANELQSVQSQDQTQGRPSQKPRRPRLDWMFNHGDLLADAFWLEQGHNKTKIEDRDGNKIYPDVSQLNYSGWRRGQEARQEDLPDTTAEADKVSTSLAIHHPQLPALPTFHPALRERSDSRHRSQPTKFLKGAIRREPDDKKTKKRRKGLKGFAKTFGSDSSEGEGISDSSGFRGRRRKRQEEAKAKAKKIDIIEPTSKMDNDPDVMQFVTPEGTLSGRSSADAIAVPSLLSSAEDIRLKSNPVSERVKEAAEKRNSIISRTGTDDGLRSRTSYEDNPTAPSSPTMNGFPSIAINLSPPVSRSPSPVRKPLPNPINFFRHERNKSQDRVGVSTTDFATLEPSPKHSRSQSMDRPQRVSTTPSPMASRDQSPFGQRVNTSPDEIGLTQAARRMERHTIQDGSSRIRGIFKGGRIAELVGNEVSRVGDFIWKRDIPGIGSGASSIASDTEQSDVDSSVLKTPPRNSLRRSHTSPKDVLLSRQSSRLGGSTPQYHISNLPSFTSPFKKDQEERGREGKQADPAPSENDARPPLKPITTNKSGLFPKLAPPKLDTSRASSPDRSYRSGTDDSRRPSYFGPVLSLTPSRASDTGQTYWTRDTIAPVTGLQAVSPSHERPASSRSIVHDASKAGFGATGPVDNREVARTSVLLLTSALKAREISRRANEVRDRPPKFLLDAFNAQRDHRFATRNVPPVPRKDEHVYASKYLTNTIAIGSDRVRSHMNQFSNSTVPNLHTSLQNIEDLIEEKLTPRVRQAADSAGDLSHTLTTASTLAIKQLNDSIDAAARRRRRGVFGGERLIRRAQWGLLEALVVVILWVVWGVVSLLRIFRGVSRLVCSFLRWLFWI